MKKADSFHLVRIQHNYIIQYRVYSNRTQAKK